jgi:hypothetical protein
MVATSLILQISKSDRNWIWNQIKIYPLGEMVPSSGFGIDEEFERLNHRKLCDFWST